MGFRRGEVGPLPPLRALLAGTGSAALFALAVPPVALPVLLLPAFLLLGLALQALPRGPGAARQGSVLGALFGGVYSVLVLHWLPSAGFPHLGWLALPAAVGAWGLHAAAGGLVLAAVAASRVPPLLALVPGWAVLVWLPGALPVAGVPWPGLESAWVEWSLASILLPLVGSTGLGALLAAVSAGLLSLGRRGVTLGLAGTLLWAALEWRVAQGVPPDTRGEGPSITLVELRLPHPFPETAGAREARVLSAVGRLVRDGPPHSGVEFWPEAPIPRTPGADAADRYLELLRVRAGALEGPLLAGAHRVREGRLRNGVHRVQGDGSLAPIHEKRRLVPGVERTVLSGPGGPGRGLAPGEAGGPFAWGGIPSGVLICFEVLFPGEVARLRRGGTRLLLQATNDSALRSGAGPFPVVADAGRRQHQAFLRARAVEFRLPVVRSAVGGPALGWDSQGRRIPETHRWGDGELGLVTLRVVPAGAAPPAAFLAPASGPVAALVLLFLMAVPVRGARPRRPVQA